MAGMRVTRKTELPDIEQHLTFGPLAAADFGGANTYYRLPFLPVRDVVIEAVTMKFNTKPSVACSFSLAKVAGGVAPPSGALSTANRASEAVDGNGQTNDTAFDLPIHPTSGARMDQLNNNVVEAGGSLFIHSTAAATSMAGGFLSIRLRTKR